jgi:hypothetical protein
MDKLDHLGWVVSSSFAIGDARFAVRSTSHAFGEWLKDVLGAYEVDDVEDFLYSVVVPEPPTDGRSTEFLILYKGSSAIVRTLDPATLGRSLLAELEAFTLHERDDAVYLMASVTEVQGIPTLLPPSLAPTLAKLGRRASKWGVGVPGQFSAAIDIETSSLVPIRPSLAEPRDALERLASALPWEGRDGLRFVREPEDVGALFVSAEDRDAPLRPARKGYTLARLASWTLNLERVGGAGLEALGRFVENADCYESSLSDGDEAIARLADALQEGT